MRLAAAVREGDANILLTNYLTRKPHDDHPPQCDRRGSRRSAGFLNWDPDPYLVVSDGGRLVWMVDGYTTSDAHPYSRSVYGAGVRVGELHPQRRKGDGGRL